MVRSLHVNQVLIQQDCQKQIVLYWVKQRDRILRNEYLVKLFFVLGCGVAGADRRGGHANCLACWSRGNRGHRRPAATPVRLNDSARIESLCAGLKQEGKMKVQREDEAAVHAGPLTRDLVCPILNLFRALPLMLLEEGSHE